MDAIARFICPICGFPDLKEKPRNTEGGGSYEICPSCGFQFGVTDDDRGNTYEEWRQKWIERGMPWDAEETAVPPRGWDPQKQLARIIGKPNHKDDDHSL